MVSSDDFGFIEFLEVSTLSSEGGFVFVRGNEYCEYCTSRLNQGDHLPRGLEHTLCHSRNEQRVFRVCAEWATSWVSLQTARRERKSSFKLPNAAAAPHSIFSDRNLDLIRRHRRVQNWKLYIFYNTKSYLGRWIEDAPLFPFPISLKHRHIHVYVDALKRCIVALESCTLVRALTYFGYTRVSSLLISWCHAFCIEWESETESVICTISLVWIVSLLLKKYVLYSHFVRPRKLNETASINLL
jgi:hypothetical protein